MPSPEIAKIERRVDQYQRELRDPVNPVVDIELFRVPVLNVKNPTGEALKFRIALLESECRITLDYVGRENLWLSGRFARQAYPIFRVIDIADGQPGEFNGSYIGEVFSGPVHPLVLIPREDVRDYLRG